MTQHVRATTRCRPSVALLAGVCGVVVLIASIAGARADARTPDQAAASQARDTRAPDVMEFEKRVQEYAALHKKIEGSIPRLPEEATPEQIDAALLQLSRGIRSARANAKAGDVFIPAMQERLRRTLKEAFSGPDGKDLRASILDENPIGAAVRINGPYPDSIPLTTMPPKVIAVLPKLPEELEFRFIGDRLILFDHHAHLIVDYVDRALPVV